MQWKSLTLLFVAIAAIIITGSSASDSPTLRLRSALISNSENFKNVMQKGCNSSNLAVLDPYLKDYVTFSKKTKKEGVEMELRDFTVTGLSNFLIINNRSEKASKRQRANFDVLLPQIQILGQLRGNITHRYLNKGKVATNVLINIKFSDLRLYFDYDVNFNGTLRELLKMDVRLLLGNVALNNFIIGLSAAENSFYNKILGESILFAAHEYLGVSYDAFEDLKDQLLEPLGNVTIDQVIKQLDKITNGCVTFSPKDY